jgi:hypothetical protein
MVFRDRSRQSSQYTDIQRETRSVAGPSGDSKVRPGCRRDTRHVRFAREGALNEVEVIAVMPVLPASSRGAGGC